MFRAPTPQLHSQAQTSTNPAVRLASVAAARYLTSTAQEQIRNALRLFFLPARGLLLWLFHGRLILDSERHFRKH